MTEKPNDKFIRFLKIYGPWTGSNNQFDEYVSDNAADLGIEPFHFTIPALQEYKDQLTDLIKHKMGKLVLICGQAGDGKTHMLHQMYLDESLIGVGPQAWKEQLANKELISHFIYQDLQYTVVKDLSTIDSDIELLKLAPSLCDTLQVKLPKLKKEFHELKIYLETAINKQKLAHMVLIAGNNGKILERFKRLNELFESDVVPSVAIEQLEDHMIHHSFFNHEHIRCFDLSVCLDETVVEEIYHTIYDHERWSVCEQCSRYELCPIVNNRALLRQEQVKERVKAMYHLLSDNGTHFTVRNILVELINALLGNKSNPITSRFFTCQKVLNATKDGAQKLNEIISLPFDNLLGLNLTSSSSKKVADIAPIFQQLDQLKIGQYSTRLIDRFIMFGAQSQISVIKEGYEQYIKVKGFEQTISKLENSLYELTHDDISENKSSSVLDSMQTPLQSLRTMLFFTMPQEKHFQNINSQEQGGLFNPFLLTAFKHGQEYLQLKELVLSAKSLLGNKTAQSLIVGLNRAFTNLMIIGSEDELIVTTNNTLNDQMICVVDDKNRFILKCDFAQGMSEQVLKIVPSPLVDDYQGLMCLAFYGKNTNSKYTLNQKSRELLNKLNQLGQQQNEAIANQADQADLLQLNLEIQKVSEQLQNLNLPEEKPHLRHIAKLAVKRQCDSNLLADSYNNYGSNAELICYLKLTPKIFEYLISLASGKMSISFSQECQQTIANFKDNLLSYLSRTRTHYLTPTHNPADDENLELSLSIGHREYCNRIVKGQGRNKLGQEQVRTINQRINNIVFFNGSDQDLIK